MVGEVSRMPMHARATIVYQNDRIKMAFSMVARVVLRERVITRCISLRFLLLPSVSSLLACRDSRGTRSRTGGVGDPRMAENGLFYGINTLYTSH